MEKRLNVTISTPYHTLNELTDRTKNIWFCCHGQGQLAEYFIKKFETLDPEENFIVAPQGISKYYLNGFTGRVGASWMTKEDRLTEIENQQSLLMEIWNKEVGDPEGRSVILFGFSQGVATISRFVAHSKVHFDKMVLWAGGFAHDIDKSHFEHLAGKETVQYYTSEEDPFYQPQMVPQQKERVKSTMGIDPQVIFYKGGHRVIPDLLSGIV
ncbi:MAG: alpha/beta hydrolase [Cyclobacteriaceae bacterium]